MTERNSLETILNSPGSPMGNGSVDLSGFTIGDSMKSSNEKSSTSSNAMTSASSVPPPKSDDISRNPSSGAPDRSPSPSVFVNVRVAPDDNTSKNLAVIQAKLEKDDPQVELQIGST